MSDRKSTFVIAGASLAGAKAAETLRKEAFDGRIVLIGEEPDRPYERPPLSKTYLRGEVTFDSVAVHPEAFYAEHDIDLRVSTSVVSIDAGTRTVELDPGGILPYDALLIATGAEVRRLSIPGSDLGGIHYLRSRASCDELQSALREAGRLVVVGGGWIGCEVAASARQMGVDVALVEAAKVPLERVLGAEVGAMFADVHREHGVDLHLGVGVDGFQGRNGVAEAVLLADGTAVEGDLFVVGVGAIPRTELAEKAGLTIDNGIVTDAQLATSAPGIWAAGDVANAFHPLLERHIRLEHWSSALNQGPTAARNMLGQGQPYEKVPYFYSDQYDLGMEYSGHATTWDEIVYRGDRDGREVVVFWLDRGVVVAGMNVNVWDVADDIATIVRRRVPLDRDRLTDVDIPIGDVLGA